MHELIIIIARYFAIIPVLVLAYIFIRSSSKHRKELLAFSFFAVVSAVVLAKLATTIFHDPRPFISDGVKPYFASSTDNGFPSDHTVFSALLALIVFRVSKKLGVGLLLIAVLIGSARVVAGVHHTKDVAGGLIIAGVSYGLACLLFKLLPITSKSTK